MKNKTIAKSIIIFSAFLTWTGYTVAEERNEYNLIESTNSVTQQGHIPDCTRW